VFNSFSFHYFALMINIFLCTFPLNSFQDRLTPDLSFPHLLRQVMLNPPIGECQCAQSPSLITILTRVSPTLRSAVQSTNSSVMILNVIGKDINKFSTHSLIPMRTLSSDHGTILANFINVRKATTKCLTQIKTFYYY